MHQSRKKSKVDEFSIGNSGDEPSIGNSGKNPERKRFAESQNLFNKVYSVIIILLKQYFLTNNFINVLTSSTLY